LDAPSPTATTVGSCELDHDPGKKLDQSFGECWKSVEFPFESVTGTSTRVPEYSTRSVPDASRYFCVGHANE
jgi:hypothetical protein